MKKTLSVIMLATLVMSTGIQAKIDKERIVFGSIGALMLAGSSYCFYKASNSPDANSAAKDWRILNTILANLKNENGYMLMNGLAQQVDELANVLPEAKNALKAEMQTYDNHISMNRLQETRTSSQSIKTLVTTHIGTVNAIRNRQTDYTFAGGMLGSLAFYPLFAAFFW